MPTFDRQGNPLQKRLPDDPRAEAPLESPKTATPALNALYNGQDEQAPAAPVDEQALRDSARQGPGGFINIGRYVQANQGQGQNMANALTGKVRAEGQAATDAISAASAQATANANSDADGKDHRLAISTTGAAHVGADASPWSYARPASASTPAAQPGSTPAATPAATAASAATAGQSPLSAIDPGVKDQADKAASDANALTNDAGRMTALRNQYGNGANYYGTEAAGFDSFLTGMEGHSDLAKTQQEFGGLENTFKLASDAAGAELTARQGRDAARWKELADRQDVIRRQVAGDQAARDKEDLDQKNYATDRAGKQSFDDYQNTNQTENTVKDVAEALDPVAWILKASGNKTLEQLSNTGFEKTVNDNGGSMNSNKVNWGAMTSGPDAAALGIKDATPHKQQVLYDSFTTAELKALEQMSMKDQLEAIAKRWKELESKGKFNGDNPFDKAMNIRTGAG